MCNMTPTLVSSTTSTTYIHTLEDSIYSPGKQHQQQKQDSSSSSKEMKKEAAGAVYLIDPMILNSHQLGTGQKVNLPRENSSQA